MGQGILEEVQDGLGDPQGTHREVREGSGDPQGGPGVGEPGGICDGSGDPLGGPRRVGEVRNG